MPGSSLIRIWRDIVQDNRCKKCLLYEMAERASERDCVKRYIENLEPEDRTGEDEYYRRLSVCKECDMLLEAMCRACGCYVEIRAALGKQKCPYNKWDNDSNI